MKRHSARWVKTELRSAKLGDRRLDKRLAIIVEAFANLPQASIPQASGLWSKTKATYRFLNNDKVTPQNILQPHQQATQQRVSQKKVVLAVQDTTSLNYTHLPQTQGLGHIGTDPRSRGIIVHTTLALTPERLPLGIICQQSWTRPHYGSAKKRRKKSIDYKESQKWLHSFAATEELQKQIPQTLLINVADRESDVYELFLQAARCRTKLLIRAAWDRRVDHCQKHLWPYLEAQPLAATQQVQITRRKEKKSRTASVEIRFAKVTLKPPRRAPALCSLSLYAVYVNEPHPPRGEPALSWMLLTTIKLHSAAQAIQCSQYYAVRFTIEMFHKVLKSGCRVEKRQLQSAEGLRRCLAIDSLIACRILALTMLGRTVPDLPCSVIFEDHEWQSLYCFIHQTAKPPMAAPSLNQAIGWIARLGGFLGRKGDGHPGAIVLWRGLQRLSDISLAWITFRQ
jgi:hypothetical protein